MSLLSALQTLAGPPTAAGQNRNHERDRTLAAANARRFELETALGLPVSAPSIGATRLAAEIERLETMVADKTGTPQKPAAVSQAPVAVPTAPARSFALPTAAPAAAAPVAAPEGVRPLAEYMRIGAAERRQFCEDGNALLRADFQQLNSTQKMQFCRHGGRVHEDRKPTANFSKAGKFCR